MRLINARSLALEQFFGDATPKYAILSHTWDEGELSYQDWQERRNEASKRDGYFKIVAACQQALKHGLNYAWVDTVCIDKTSSAELSEAINSMFAWYRDAVFCYAYLSDVEYTGGELDVDGFCNSRWFTRGWTLQELLAPSWLIFFSKEWVMLGRKSSSRLLKPISEVTGVDIEYLAGASNLGDASVAKRMYWLSRRRTTRVEDLAYCVLGIFGINMPLIYGEGMRAFVRLQEEIIKVSRDHTIFCWNWTDRVPPRWTGLLAPSPETFSDSKDYYPWEAGSPYAMTNAGLSIRLGVVKSWSSLFIILNARRNNSPNFLRPCIAVDFIASSWRPHWVSRPDWAHEMLGRIPGRDFPTTGIIPLSMRHTPSSAISTQQIYLNASSPVHLTPMTRDVLGSRRMSICATDNQHELMLFLNTEYSYPRYNSRSYPPDAFDASRSIFRLSRDVTVSGDIYHSGLLLLADELRPGLFYAVFFGIRDIPPARYNSDLIWYCAINCIHRTGCIQSHYNWMLKKFFKSSYMQQQHVQYLGISVNIYPHNFEPWPSPYKDIMKAKRLCPAYIHLYKSRSL